MQGPSNQRRLSPSDTTLSRASGLDDARIIRPSSVLVTCRHLCHPGFTIPRPSVSVPHDGTPTRGTESSKVRSRGKNQRRKLLKRVEHCMFCLPFSTAHSRTNTTPPDRTSRCPARPVCLRRRRRSSETRCRGYWAWDMDMDLKEQAFISALCLFRTCSISTTGHRLHELRPAGSPTPRRRRLGIEAFGESTQTLHFLPFHILDHRTVTITPVFDMLP